MTYVVIKNKQRFEINHKSNIMKFETTPNEK